MTASRTLDGASCPIQTQQRLPRSDHVAPLGHDLDDSAGEGGQDLGHVLHLPFELLQLDPGPGDLMLARLQGPRVPRFHRQPLETELRQLLASRPQPLLRRMHLLAAADHGLSRQTALVDEVLLRRDLLPLPAQAVDRGGDGLFEPLAPLAQLGELQGGLFLRMRCHQVVLDAQVVQDRTNLTDPTENVRLCDTRDHLPFANDVTDVDGYVGDAAPGSRRDFEHAAALEKNALAGDPGGDAPFEPPKNR